MSEERTTGRTTEQATEQLDDTDLLRRAELALTQLNNQHGLSPAQAATLTAIRLRLEGKQRASLDDLLTAGKDLGDRDELREALERKTSAPSFEDVLKRATKPAKRSLDDLL
jgi:hypothetical protein